jgi:large subunit ribosomal protein L31
MKKKLHPDNYRPVVFQDLNNNQTFITKSTVASEETITLDGVEYPLIKVYISSASHPFFTGQEKLVDVEGRVDKFKARVQAAEDRKAKAAKKAEKPASKNTEEKSETEKPIVEKIGNLKPSNS